MITPLEFAVGCQRLIPVWERWTSDKPRWEWVEATGAFNLSLGGGYLAMQKAPVITRAVEDTEGGFSINVDRLVLQEEDPAATPEPAGPASVATATGRRQLHLYNHYMVYSPSFGVPVWYFEGHDPGGSPLSLAHVLADLGLANQDEVEIKSLISQEEHPVLRRPCFMLHPCQTDAIMGIVTSEVAAARDGSVHSAPTSAVGQHTQEQLPAVDPLLYIMAWLSIAGKFFNMELPLDAWAEYWHTAG